MLISPNGAWKKLVADTLLGTGRHPPTPIEAAGPLGELLGALDRAETESLVLRQAGILSVYRAAGRLPDVDERPLSDPAPPEARPRCAPGAALRLATILSGRYPELLGEWVELALAAGVRAPEQVLPELLDAGERSSAASLRARMIPVLGNRGLWLAEQLARWKWVAPHRPVSPEADAEAWQSGSSEVRRAILTNVRACDPSRGRALVESTWAEDPAADRESFLRAFSTGLSLEDESFLEACLDDRSRDVRQQAAALLGTLPGSRRAARIWDRLTPLVGAERESTGEPEQRRLRLSVELPPELSPELKRDGIAQSVSNLQGFGPRGMWLHQMIAAIPPSNWCAHWEAEPDELLAAAAETDWKHLLTSAWRTAAHRFRDATWAEALLRSPFAATDDTGERGERWETLIEVLAPERAEQVILDHLRSDWGHFQPALPVELSGTESDTAPETAVPFSARTIRVLGEYRRPWSSPFTGAVLAALRRNARGVEPTLDWQVRSSLKDLARYAHPDAAEQAGSGWPEGDENKLGNAPEAFIDLLHFRREMHQEFAG